MGIFLVANEVWEQTFIKAGHGEPILHVDSTGTDPVSSVHRERPEATRWKR